ncbi:MAG: NADH-quinone oxidoreductase subunit L [Deltaproteobacteria bacterium]|nr:NADH-quinone oxidoreductase subunit L [Deltaproteobacteria bacterium]
MKSQALLLLVVVLPALCAGVTGLIPYVRRRGMLAGTLSSLTVLATLVMSLVLLGRANGGEKVIVNVQWMPEAGKTLAEFGLRLDGISAPMLVVVSLVAAMVQIYSLSYLHEEPSESLGRYFTWHSLFVFSMQALVVSTNLMQLFGAWELVGLCSYLLIGYWWAKPSAGKAAVKAFWVNKFGDAAFLIAIILFHAQYKTWDIDALENQVRVTPPGALVVLLLFMGVMSKSAQFPLHVWLPDAMEGPTPVSALLHAATMVAAGVYLLVRFFPVFAANADALTVIMYIGIFTALFAALTATVQTDVKKVLAYSTCSQLGYMVAAVGAGGKLAAYFHLTTHAFFKALLFLAAGSIIHGVHSNELPAMGGLWKKMKLTTVLFGIGVLAIAGIPGFSGFFSKDLVLEQLEHHTVVWVVGLLTAGLTAYYMGKAFVLAFAGEARSDGAAHAHESGLLMTGPMVLLAVLAVVAGFFANPFARLTHLAEPGFHLTTTGILALVLALGGLGAAWLFHGPRAKDPAAVPGFLAPVDALVKAGLVDRFYEWSYRVVMLGLAKIIGWVDRYLVDGVMNLFGWVALEGGAALRVVQTGRAPDYVFAVVVGLVALMAWGYVGG